MFVVYKNVIGFVDQIAIPAIWSFCFAGYLLSIITKKDLRLFW